MLKKLCLALLLGLLSTSAFAQVVVGGGGGGTGTGSTEPSSFLDPIGTLVIGGATNAVTLSVDRAVIPGYAQGTTSPGATCSPGDFYFETDLTLHICKATNTWAPLFTFVDDSVMLGSGTAYEPKAIPDCDDSGGNHLNYDTATNAFSCGTSGGGAAFDPGTTVTFYDDFLGGTLSTGLLGTNGVNFTAVSTGTVSNAVATAGTVHPGVYRLNSHATNDNSGIALSVINSGQTVSNVGAAWDSSDWQIDGVFMLGSNSTAITSTGFWFGLSDNVGTIPGTNGIFIRRDTDLSETAFAFVVCNTNGASGCASAADSTNIKVSASTITPSAGTWYRFRIRQLQSGVGGNRTIYFRVNGETEVTFCSSGCTDTLGTVPSGVNMTLVVQYLTRTTTGVMSGDVDYLYFTITGLTRY